MATPKVKKIPVNEDKFLKILKKRGLTQAEVCRGMYKCDSSIRSSLRRGHFTDRMAEALEKEWNISPEMYAPDPVDEETQTEILPPVPLKDVCADEYYDRLYHVIYNAVYDAVKRAWNE